MEKISIFDFEMNKAKNAARGHALRELKKRYPNTKWKQLGRETISKSTLPPTISEIDGSTVSSCYKYQGSFVDLERNNASVTGTVYPREKGVKKHTFENFKIQPGKIGSD